MEIKVLLNPVGEFAAIDYATNEEIYQTVGSKQPGNDKW